MQFSRPLVSLCRFLVCGFATLILCVSNVSAQDETEAGKQTTTKDNFLQMPLQVNGTLAGIPELDEITDDHLQVARLGRELFFDPLLSSDGTTSCSTCHIPEHGFSSPEAVTAGVGGKKGRRHAPAIINRHLGDSHFWDGRAPTLEDQALEPIQNDVELGSSIEEVLKKLSESEKYSKHFKEVFDDGVTEDNLATAIAGFERLLVNADSRIDQFVTAKKSVLTRAERQGLWLYESKGGCWQCHTGQNYSDEKFHNTGVSWGKEPLDLGRFEHTKDEAHKGQFKTPTLREVGHSRPYMHDGSIKTLREVVEFYNRGGDANPNLDSKIKPLDLSEQEINDLVAFLKALNGRYVWEPQVEAKPVKGKDAAGENYEKGSKGDK